MPDRDDQLGFGASSARLSQESGAGFTERAETAIELYWSFRVLPGLRIKPDVQYVVDPGGDASLDDAWIATLRATFAL
jgi:porin